MKAVIFITVLAPLLLVFQINHACIQYRIPAAQCDPHQKSAALVSQVVTTVFAWLATPPR
jgi:hypothetical protein